MAKFVADSVLDALLAALEVADQLVICEGQPADYTAATTDHPTGNALGEIAITAGDFTKADGDVSGRKTTIAQQTGVDVDVTGTADHIALVDDGGTELLLVTTISNSQGVTAGNTATVQSFDDEVADAT